MNGRFMVVIIIIGSFCTQFVICGAATTTLRVGKYITAILIIIVLHGIVVLHQISNCRPPFCFIRMW
jgi:hypothetical protein